MIFMQNDVMEFILMLLKNLLVVGVAGIYYLTLVYFIGLFFKILDWIFER